MENFKKFKADIYFTSTEEGGKKMPIKNKDYRTVIEIGDKNMDVILVPEEGDIIYPGESRIIEVFIHVRSLAPIEHLMLIGALFLLREGAKIIGKGIILDTDF